MSLRLSVGDYHDEAKRTLPKMVYDYYSSGARSEITLRHNEDDYQRILLLPKVLIDVSAVDASTTVLGHKISSPIMVAPTAMHRMAHPDGERATYKAASRAGTLFGLSSLSTVALEEVAQQANGPRWFQLYVSKDREYSLTLIRRAEAAGYTALLVTVDAPILGVRERDVKNKFHLPYGLKLGNFEAQDRHLPAGETAEVSALGAFFKKYLDPALSWKDIEWLTKQTKLPVLVKGLMSPADAVLACRAGAAGIVVSNHGARQLDTVPSTIAALPLVVRAVGGQIPVFVDGGIRRGTDVIKALALGAKGVFVGRPALWGLSVNGEEGVFDVISLLKAEFEQAMILAGVRSISEIDETILYKPSLKFLQWKPSKL